MMKISYLALVIVLLIILVLPSITSSRHVNRSRYYRNPHRGAIITRMRGRAGSKAKGPGRNTVEIAGSRLPDCARIFVCSSLEEAEICPMAYKCMCNNKSFPVP
ncbi:hypothetical protein RND81_06G148300 [Saponaria officinalis]|uniref:Uncharacterized protein n=1 Tax=Saponaria officinalis TaxID=3572 RepID=A0AAW1K6U9_SAPOF